MNTRRILTAGALLGLSLTASAQGSCEDGSYCTFFPWQPAGLAANAANGSAVAYQGRTAVVGAPGADAVFVYRRTGGEWSEVQRIDGPEGTFFGNSIDLDRGRLVVSAHAADIGATDTGRVYVYDFDGDEFQLIQELVPLSPVPFGQFGYDVAISGPWIGVGEPGSPNGGSVDMFKNNGGTFLPLDTVTGFGSDDEFGAALDIDGTRLVIGDWKDDSAGNNAGAVYHFSLAGFVPMFEQKILPVGLQAGDLFGIDVAIDGDRAVFGSSGNDDVEINAGAAYVYGYVEAPGPTFTYEEIDRVHPCDANILSDFGRRVAIGGGRIAVGARHQEDVLDPGGKVYVFAPLTFPSETWLPAGRITPDLSEIDDFVGSAVAIDGEHVLVGSAGMDLSGSNTGGAYFVSFSTDSILGGECPCDVLADMNSYGTPVPGTLGAPLLELTSPPVVGESTLIRISNLQAGSQPFLYMGTGAPSVPFTPRAPMGVGSTLLTFPTVTAFQSAGLLWDIPQDFSLCGTDVHMVAFFLDAGAPAPMNLAVTNSLRASLGY